MNRNTSKPHIKWLGRNCPPKPSKKSFVRQIPKLKFGRPPCFYLFDLLIGHRYHEYCEVFQRLAALIPIGTDVQIHGPILASHDHFTVDSVKLLLELFNQLKSHQIKLFTNDLRVVQIVDLIDKEQHTIKISKPLMNCQLPKALQTISHRSLIQQKDHDIHGVYKADGTLLEVSNQCNRMKVVYTDGQWTKPHVPPSARITYFVDDDTPFEFIQEYHQRISSQPIDGIKHLERGIMNETLDEETSSEEALNEQLSELNRLAAILKQDLSEIELLNGTTQTTPQRLNFRITEVKFRNVLSYQDCWHNIEFEDHQTICIVGANASGKSNIIKIILAGLFGPDKSRGSYQASSFLNKHSKSDTGSIQLKFSFNDRVYTIARSFVAKGKSLKYTEANLSVNGIAVVEGSKPSLLDKQIQKMIGNHESFSKTSIFSSSDGVPVIDDTPRKASDSLVKFFHLDQFETLEEIAKKESVVLKNQLKLAQTKIDTLSEQRQHLIEKIGSAITDQEIDEKNRILHQLEDFRHRRTELSTQLHQISVQIKQNSHEFHDLSSFPDYDELESKVEALRSRMGDVFDPNAVNEWHKNHTKAAQELVRAIKSDDFQGLFDVTIDGIEKLPDLTPFLSEYAPATDKRDIVLKNRFPEIADHNSFLEQTLKDLKHAVRNQPADTVNSAKSCAGTLSELLEQLKTFNGRFDGVPQYDPVKHQDLLENDHRYKSPAFYVDKLDRLTNQDRSDLAKLLNDVETGTYNYQRKDQLVQQEKLKKEFEDYQFYSGVIRQCISLIVQELEMCRNYQDRQFVHGVLNNVNQLHLDWLKLDKKRDQMDLAKQFHESIEMLEERELYQEWTADNQRVETANVILIGKADDLRDRLGDTNRQLDKLNLELNQLIKADTTANALNQELEHLEKKIKCTEDLIFELQPKLELWLKYRKLVGKTGIPIAMLSKQLGSIVAAANSLIETVAEFRIDLEPQTTKAGYNEIHLVMIKHGNKLNIRQLSGYEKFVLRIAFQHALNKIGYLPTSQLFCIDEGLDCVDHDNWSNISKILTHLRDIYSNVLVITHSITVSHLDAKKLKIAMDGLYSTISMAS